MTKKRLFIISFLLLIGGFMLWNIFTSPVNSSDKHTEIFVVEKGQGVKTIAQNLEQKKLIKNQTVFFLLVKKMGIENKIRAGSFRLSPSQSSEQIATALTKSSLDVWITVPEGKRAEEIAEILQKSMPSYQSDWLQKLQTLEGYLFPDTYLIPIDANIDQIIAIMRTTFDQKYASISNNKPSLTQQEIVTIASLIEREARHDEDRSLIASVIYNRLDLGMPLQIDATVQYIVGYQENERSWWKRHLSLADLKINSAYNTYIHQGIPPGPIANPGIKSLQAAMNPAETNYLYYMTDKNGINHYATTNEGHERNIEKYGL